MLTKKNHITVQDINFVAWRSAFTRGFRMPEPHGGGSPGYLWKGRDKCLASLQAPRYTC